jgi:type I restriction enzyme S subunit
LGAIDDKIENNRRINTNLELQAKALYKQWFVDNRSDDWEVGKVSDYYDITIGKTPPRKEKQWFSNNPKDSVWVSISDMGSCGAYISDSSEYLTTKAVDKFNIKVVPNNTVLLSFKLTVGRVAISDGAMTTNEAIAHFNTLNDYLTEYTYLALKAYNFANLGSTSSIATAVNSKIIKSMLWVMPNDNVLRDFHNIVAPIFTQIKNNIRENETLATLRDTLLPKLMNGEIKM